MTKAELREEIHQRFKDSTTEERELWSRDICNNILQDSRIDEAKTILAFYPLRDEVNIIPLINVLHARNKLVLLPEVISSEEMVLKEYCGDSCMVKGKFGTTNSTGVLFNDYEKIDVVLVPGVAFTTIGERLGRGKGYYDRFLPRVKGAYKRGVCFPFQMVNSIPCDAHDAKMDYV